MIKIYQYGEVSAEEIFARENLSANVEDIVAGILAEVKANGDKALLDYTEKFDKVRLPALEVSDAEIEEAFAQVDGAFIAILDEAAANIRAFHEKQKRNSFIINEKTA